MTQEELKTYRTHCTRDLLLFQQEGEEEEEKKKKQKHITAASKLKFSLCYTAPVHMLN
jgi:hypothetical protein